MLLPWNCKFQKFFIVGSNNNQTKFRVLKIDRTEPYDLVIVDDNVEYTEKEVHQLLQSAIKVKGSASLPKRISAFGIVGKISSAVKGLLGCCAICV